MTDVIQWDPWQELERLRIQTDRLWDEFLGKLPLDEMDIGPIAFVPDIDLVETPGEFRIYMSLPGLIEEDLELTIDDQLVTIRGEREPPYDPSHAACRTSEWRYGYFQRDIQLPAVVLPSRVRASCDAGVLTIVLPKV